MPAPAETGRGAWSRRGNVKGLTYYVQGCSVSETRAVSQDLWAVNRGVLSIQRLLGVDYASGPGIFGPKTHAAVVAFQRKAGLPDAGFVGKRTAQALLRPLIQQTEKGHLIPDRLLGGLIGQESAWDFGAVGVSTPLDVGPVQISLRWNPGVTPDQATDYGYAIAWAAQRMRTFAMAYMNTAVDVRWAGAVLNHHNPSWARDYVTTGIWPNAQSEAYVERVRALAVTWA